MRAEGVILARRRHDLPVGTIEPAALRSMPSIQQRFRSML
jgi:hypothetical protein